MSIPLIPLGLVGVSAVMGAADNRQTRQPLLGRPGVARGHVWAEGMRPSARKLRNQLTNAITDEIPTLPPGQDIRLLRKKIDERVLEFASSTALIAKVETQIEPTINFDLTGAGIADRSPEVMEAVNVRACGPPSEPFRVCEDPAKSRPDLACRIDPVPACHKRSKGVYHI
ncbi:hypothetical protein D9615_006764 [Tricholomella constricta]|uniref:Uncharacterized protein n=1 Tax=Tricholomella constricta TaxID=117010 RepID=A0A8H5H767_9AGAR|nr:hypothetical protein D9615_006764 [Tricholomella constricta]